MGLVFVVTRAQNITSLCERVSAWMGKGNQHKSRAQFCGLALRNHADPGKIIEVQTPNKIYSNIISMMSFEANSSIIGGLHHIFFKCITYLGTFHLMTCVILTKPPSHVLSWVLPRWHPSVTSSPPPKTPQILAILWYCQVKARWIGLKVKNICPPWIYVRCQSPGI